MNAATGAMFVNPPFGLQSPLYGNQRIVDYDNAGTRPFFVPPGFMRIGLEIGRLRCCAPGLYDLGPHEMFQAVLMKFCAPGQATCADAVVDLPIGDFTQSLHLRQPASHVFDLQLVVQARITAMKKFVKANSFNPGALIYVMFRSEVIAHLERRRPPSELGSETVLNAINEKTSTIGLSIRSIFVDHIVYDKRVGFGGRSMASAMNHSRAGPRVPIPRPYRSGFDADKCRVEADIDDTDDLFGPEEVAQPKSSVPEDSHDDDLCQDRDDGIPSDGESDQNNDNGVQKAGQSVIDDEKEVKPTAISLSSAMEPSCGLGPESLPQSAAIAKKNEAMLALLRNAVERGLSQSGPGPCPDPAADNSSDKASTSSSSSAWSLCDAEAQG